VYRPTTVDGVREVFALSRETGLPIALRAGGNSYGDAATGAERIVLDMTRMDRILSWDPKTGVICVEPGVTIERLWKYAIGDGWWPHVVPGTMAATVGGCAAMNVHGKNHVQAGVFGDYVDAFEMLLPATNEVVRCSRAEHPDLFYAGIGSFGVLGVFTSLTLRLRRVASGLVRSRQIAVDNLDAMFAAFNALGPKVDYIVGWIDGFAKGESLGRGLIQTNTYLAEGEDPAPAQSLRVERQDAPDTLLGFVPRSIAWRLMRPWMNDLGMEFLNGARMKKARLLPAPALTESLASSQFLLNYVPHWKRSYGDEGLLQYQCQIPDGTARAAFRQMLELCQRRGYVPYLVVFKKHRAADDYWIRYSVDGWSVALDFKVTHHNRTALRELAADMDRIVLECGGRFYFAKDQTLLPSRMEAMLGDAFVQRFLALKRQVDPEDLLETDLFRRLFGATYAATAAPRPTSVTAAADAPPPVWARIGGG
jgi:FAD/FMN-containing dehydrogenase